MKTYNLAKLEKVELLDVWPHEAHDFTPWLAEESNLEMLGDAIGIELELIETESSVGSFSVDIYASEVGTSRKVVIEISSRRPTTITWARSLPMPLARMPR